MPEQASKRTHFGFRQVSEARKSGLVTEVFDSVVDRYDLMNDLMSVGAHRLWKRFALTQSGVRPGDRVLDVAAGSGDLAAGLARRIGASGELFVTDINAAMLSRGRRRLVDDGVVGRVRYVQADAEGLPFSDNSFDCITIGFGLRNVTRVDRALASMFRCLRPAGRLLVLEFSRPPHAAVRSIYDAYSFGVLPRLGRMVAGDEASYQYLVESIRKHPPQAELKAMMEAAGFERVRFHNLTGGVVALHVGFKL